MTNRGNAVRIAVAVAFSVSLSAQARTPQLQLDHLSRLSSQAHEVVDIAVDSTMLQQTLGLFAGEKAQDAATRALVSGLKGVYVKSFEFDREGAYSERDVEAVRSQLKAPWSRIVNVNSREDRELVEIYMWRENDRDPSGGLAIVVAEPKELTIVNIVGHIDLSQLSALKGIVPGVGQSLGAVPGGGATKP